MLTAISLARKLVLFLASKLEPNRYFVGTAVVLLESLKSNVKGVVNPKPGELSAQQNAQGASKAGSIGKARHETVFQKPRL